MRERLKSAALALLLLLAVGLSYVSLTLGVSSSALSGNWLSGLRGGTDAGAETEAFTASAAAWPEKLAVLTENGLYQAADETHYAALWTEVQPFYEEALGSGGTPETIAEPDFEAALRAPAVLLSYGTALPYALLRVWCDAAAEDSALTVRSVVLCAENDAVALLFRDGSGACWKMQTAAAAQTLDDLCGGDYVYNAVLAANDGSCAALLPEEPVLTGALSVAECTLAPTAAASGELPRAVLAAFSLNPYLAKIYQDSEGGTVYVESRSTLQATAAGDLIYHAAGGGIELTLPAGENETIRQARICDGAAALLGQVWTALSADGQLSLDSLTRAGAGGVYTLRFELEKGGRFLDLGDRCWAQVTVSAAGIITDVTLSPRRITEGAAQSLLPLRQAAAALEGSAYWRLSVRWLAAGAERMRPAVCKVR